MRVATLEARFLSAPLVALALLAGGCGGGPVECRQPSGELGSCCRGAEDCREGLECLQQFPGGLCSTACSGAGSCGEQAACILVESQSLGSLGRVCLPRCGPEYAACPPGLGCTATSVPELNVCFP